MNESFKKWKQGFMRKCRKSGKIWFCSPRHAKACKSSEKELSECVSGSTCDELWRKETGYNGKMLDDFVIEEVVTFT